MRARGMNAAAEFFESSESVGTEEGLSAEDAWFIAQHIEVSDVDLDDSWLPAERLRTDRRDLRAKRSAAAERLVAEASGRPAATLRERVALIRRIMMMKVKGPHQARDEGRPRGSLHTNPRLEQVVAVAVIHNPRITDKEVEGIASMRTVNDEVLRLIAMNRSWARQYPIILSLARNPRTPLPQRSASSRVSIQRPQALARPQRLRRRAPPVARSATVSNAVRG